MTLKTRPRALGMALSVPLSAAALAASAMAQQPFQFPAQGPYQGQYQYDRGQPQAQMAPGEDVDINIFEEQLAPHGRWFVHPQYGYVWTPNVDEDWRPYTRGQWVHTEEHGWYWTSDEPWGWAAYHYGRWALDDDHGWVWVPGTEWAPAWVAWRASDEHIGWAPLPPNADWSPEDGVQADRFVYEDPRFSAVWCFVPLAYLTSAAVSRFIAPPRHSVMFLRRTTPLRSHAFIGGRIVNRGFDVRRYEYITRRPVHSFRIANVSSPRGVGLRHGGGATINVFRPRIVAPGMVQGDGRRHQGAQSGGWGGARPSGGHGDHVRRGFSPMIPPSGARNIPPPHGQGHGQGQGQGQGQWWGGSGGQPRRHPPVVQPPPQQQPAPQAGTQPPNVDGGARRWPRGNPYQNAQPPQQPPTGGGRGGGQSSGGGGQSGGGQGASGGQGSAGQGGSKGLPPAPPSQRGGQGTNAGQQSGQQSGQSSSQSGAGANSGQQGGQKGDGQGRRRGDPPRDGNPQQQQQQPQR